MLKEELRKNIENQSKLFLTLNQIKNGLLTIEKLNVN